MKKKPTVLMILDGYGLNENCDHNAVCEGKTPVMDQLMSQCPFVKGNASGMAVGLPEGQMGNSEVGHLNMGAGRIVYQAVSYTHLVRVGADGDVLAAQLPVALKDRRRRIGLAQAVLVAAGVALQRLALPDNGL